MVSLVWPKGSWLSPENVLLGRKRFMRSIRFLICQDRSFLHSTAMLRALISECSLCSKREAGVELLMINEKLLRSRDIERGNSCEIEKVKK